MTKTLPKQKIEWLTPETCPNPKYRKPDHFVGMCYRIGDALERGDFEEAERLREELWHDPEAESNS